MAVQRSTRRARLREATLTEIREAARRLLTTRGPAAVTINAVAREIGMSGPALYHYFSSHDELVAAVTADFFRELTAAMEDARDARADAAPGERLLATCRAMRGWAVDHPAEFEWIFASAVPAAQSARLHPDTPRNRAANDFGMVFLGQVRDLWATAPFPVPAPDELDPSVRAQLGDHIRAQGHDLPPEALHVAMTCWIRLWGLLCMEVLNQLDFIYSDVAPIYEETLRELSGMLGLEYTPPA
ncbi:TetR/AcrR family transcriptional regulator [Actinomadura rifamycini]|uniref:TetR/AcrR family transcriptional regulator n=1 Tax=Actinomadura rifamycini TaxID=31962 RepID=UPI00042214FF|nr:TetR family transcriptional regulator [Actinomadura rifamycini]